MTDNLSNLFERRQRNIGKPLRPPVQTASAGSPSPPLHVQIPTPSSVPRVRAAKPAPKEGELESVERYSIFLSLDQAKWLQGLRGRLLVQGKDISASEVVRLALERLRTAEQTDAQLYAAAAAARGHVRGRGRPTSQR